VTISRDIRKLIRPPPRGKQRLPSLSSTRSIGASRGIAKPVGESGGNSFAERSRTFYGTVRELRSSDGLFVLEYYNVQKIVMDRATMTYLDYVPST
jgi:hypothetical protein